MPDRLPSAQAEGIRAGEPGLRLGAAVLEIGCRRIYICGEFLKGEWKAPVLLIASRVNVKNI